MGYEMKIRASKVDFILTLDNIDILSHRKKNILSRCGVSRLIKKTKKKRVKMGLKAVE